ncbi:MerR family transcriptional regulator [Cellulomonas denverensis]|uniref:MerR family transcriptional regulator n=1 Tax=Cellulomonas denverensis TaxID=264297 RepID=A0A7X6KWP2_9CELL|nr:MerR family transcriptional regulator [Cellulomonas denverensis]NKY23637.1 MerR family transcriptional regulator [Cellulomonas denverensis]GIG26883.1 MerR family transcriptional regulator [Cellulomonas denverensis]
MQNGDEPDALPEGATLTPAAVARRLGVAAATLRTWDRRYGLGPSEHTAGAHRRYTAADLERLTAMRSLTLGGVAPAEAARLARSGATGRHLAVVPDPSPAVEPGDGPVPLPEQEPVAATPTEVVDAALRGDSAAMRALLTPGEDLARWWSDLIVPARAGVAARTVLARPGDEPDEVIVAAALAALRDRFSRVPRHPSRRRVVLLFAPPGESRPLELHVLAAALADHGLDARVVAGPAGRTRLGEIVTMTSPSAAVVMSEREDPDLSVIEALSAQHPELLQFVMVPDAAAGLVPLSHRVQRVRSFAGVLHEVVAVAEGAAGGVR